MSSSIEDRGDCDPALAAALAGDNEAAICAALVNARLLVPVVAMTAEAADAEMAIPALVSADGARALPVFSSYDELRAWQPDARPVPMAGARAIAGAYEEGYDGVVLDVAGERSFTLAGEELGTLARALLA